MAYGGGGRYIQEASGRNWTAIWTPSTSKKMIEQMNKQRGARGQSTLPVEDHSSRSRNFGMGPLVVAPG